MLWKVITVESTRATSIELNKVEQDVIFRRHLQSSISRVATRACETKATRSIRGLAELPNR